MTIYTFYDRLRLIWYAILGRSIINNVAVTEKGIYMQEPGLILDSDLNGFWVDWGRL
jgi:hypothetical protein